MAHTRVWEETHPAGTEAASLGDDRIRNLKFDLGERLEVMLYGFNISDGTGDEATPGVKVLNFKEQASLATPSANQINVAAKVGVDGDAKAQLWAEDEDGNERQLTKTSGSALRLNVKAGDYAADSIDQDDIRLANNSSLTGRNQAGDGDVNIVKVNTSNEVELSAVTKLPDTSKLATSGAPTADAQIANKKYVDDQDAANFSPVSYEGGESVTLGNGLIMKMGYAAMGTPTSVTVEFGTAFPTAVISVTATPYLTPYVSHNRIVLTAVSKTAFTCRQYQANDNDGIYWTAIGY